jgi:hypothetical protein
VEEALALPADGSGEVKPVRDMGTTAPVKFDFDAAETSRQIQALSAEAGIVIKEFKMGQGKVTVLGEAAGEIMARKYLFKLLDLGKERNIQWALPTIKALENQRVQFEASGVYGNAAWHDTAPDQKAATSSKPASQAQIRQLGDDAIRLQPKLAKQWTQLKARGLLADLPAEAVVLSSNTERLEQYAQTKHILFHFSMPRDVAQHWLLDSLFVEGQREKLLNWPNPPAAFNGTFTAANNCTVIVSCSNGETVQVMIVQPQTTPDEFQKVRPFQKLRPFRPILIAPDESQQPRPAGKLAPDYKQEGFTLVAPKAPTLNPALQHLLSTISQEEALRPRAFWPPSNQVILRTPAIPSYVPKKALPAPLQRLAGELSAESEETLLRSSQSGSRMQQALVVRLPQ